MTRIGPPVRGAIALLTLLIAALLCWQCIDIYLDGNAPENLDENGVHIHPVYSVADVGARLKGISLCLLAYIPLLIALPLDNAPAAERRTDMMPANRLRLMKKRVAALPEAAVREEKLRRRTWMAAALALLGCTAMAGAYLLNGANFVSWDLEMVMGDMLLHVAPWVLLALAVVYAACVAADRSMLRESAALKGQPKGTPVEKLEKRIPVNVLRGALYMAAVVFIVLGVMNGGLYDVLVKAINICTECIGLG